MHENAHWWNVHTYLLDIGEHDEERVEWRTGMNVPICLDRCANKPGAETTMHTLYKQGAGIATLLYPIAA